MDAMRTNEGADRDRADGVCRCAYRTRVGPDAPAYRFYRCETCKAGLGPDYAADGDVETAGNARTFRVVQSPAGRPESRRQT